MLAWFVRKRLLFPLIIFLTAFLLRYCFLSVSEVGTDETLYIYAGVVYVDNLLNLDTTWDNWVFNSEHPPLAKYLIGMVLYNTFFVQDRMVRHKSGWWLESVQGPPTRWEYVLPVRVIWTLIGSLGVVLVYFLGRDYAGYGFGFLASIIMSINPLWLFYTINAYQLQPLMVLLAVAGQLSLYSGINRNRSDYFLLSAILFGLSLSSNYLALPVILGSSIWLLNKRIKTLKKPSTSMSYGWELIRQAILNSMFPALIFLTFLFVWGLWLIPNGVVKCLVFSLEKSHRNHGLPLIFERTVHFTWEPLCYIFLGSDFLAWSQQFQKLNLPLFHFTFYPWESILILIGLVVLAKKGLKGGLSDFEELTVILFFTGVAGLSIIPGNMPHWLLFLVPETSILATIPLHRFYRRWAPSFRIT